MTDRLFYQVIDGPLSVRNIPGTAGARVGELPNRMIVEVDAASRSSVDGFVWWKHGGGWSAESSADGKTVFMQTVTQAVASPDAEPQFYQVVNGPVSIRLNPDATSPKRGELPNGTVIEALERASGGGFAWARHERGWSAIGKVDGTAAFMQPTAIAPVVTPSPIAPSPVSPSPIAPSPIAPSPVSPTTPVTLAPATSLAPAGTRFFLVTDGPVSIRENPEAAAKKVGELPNGKIIQVLENSLTISGVFVYWQHAQGWSAEGRTDASQIFMTATTAPAETSVPDKTPEVSVEPEAELIRYFQVTDGPVTVRKAPDPVSEKVGEITNGAFIEVIPESRTLNAGFVYWQHSRGWSAERRLGGGAAFMTAVAELPPPAPVKDLTVLEDGTPIQFFEVIEGPISIRGEPVLTGERLGQFSTGEQFEVVQRSRTENQGCVWWQHSKGWSPERKLGSETGYLTVIPKLTRKVVDGIPYLPLIVQHPVALVDTQWIQYYGNTTFAQKLRSEGKFWYNYCQSLHGGFDYGTSKPVPIVAGIEGTVIDINLNKATYAPNYTRIKAGPYSLIYGHMARPTMFNIGDRVSPGTVLGFIDADGQNHLHLEVRLGLKVLNPLEIMTEERRNEITGRFKDLPKHFYKGAAWGLWQDPYDQPVLNLQNKGSEVIIGPHAR